MAKMKRGVSTISFGGAARAVVLSAAALAVTTTAYSVYPQSALAQQFSFNSVTVEGNGRVSPDTILSYAGIARGETLSAGELNDAYQAVLASGLFETVEFVPQGNTLLIRVSEYPMVSRINIEGNRTLSDEELQPLIQTQTRRSYSPSTLEQDAAAITDAYEAKGLLAATIDPKIIRRDGNRVDVVFEVTEGKNTEIERISFVGNRSFSDSRLRRVLESKQAGILRFIVGRDTYSEERLAFDQRVLTDFYQSRGFVDFEIVDVAAEFARERNANFVTFSVREGQPYDFGTVTVSSTINGVDAAAFSDAINIRKGQTYSPVAIEDVTARMEAIATREGIDFLRVEPRITRNDRNQTLDVNFVLVRGDRIFIERIDIEGNATTLDRVVRRQFRVVEGDPFNPREIREAANRIRALGYFADADVNAVQGSSGEQVVIDVNVTEQPTGSFSFGANYSVSDGANLVVNFRENNFLGRGQRLSFSLTTDLDDGGLSFRFEEPAFLGRNVAFGVSAGLSSRQPGYQEHLERSGFISPYLTFPVSDLGALTVNYRLGVTELTNPDDATLPAMIQEDIDEGRVTTQSVGYRYTYDNRRSGLDPNAGFIFSFGQDYAGVGGDVSFTRTRAELRAETKVWNDEVTLRAGVEGGMIESDDGTRVNDRFFNTSSIIRGFEPGGIGPRDVDGTGLALGGNYYAVARLESEFPLGLPEEYGLSAGLFLDHGSVWGLDDPGSVDDDIYWRSVVGASIFWTTPIGPLRFNFTHALQKEDYDEEQTFDLTISTQF